MGMGLSLRDETQSHRSKEYSGETLPLYWLNYEYYCASRVSRIIAITTVFPLSNYTLSVLSFGSFIYFIFLLAFLRQ